VDDRTSGALLLAIGGIGVRLGLTDAALAYVKAGLQIPLLVAGVILIVLGGIQVVHAFRGTAPVEPEDELDHHSLDDGHGHSHNGGPRVAWLLTLPLLALLLVAPPPLGAFAASRQSDALSKPVAATFGPLPAEVDGAVELTTSDYVYRALYDTDRSLDGKTIRLTGFITAAEAKDEADFRLTRFILSCCAADGQAINVAVRSDQPPPPVETWVEIEGTWLERPGHEVGELTTLPPLLQLESMREIPQPAQPYEY
jgi:uncharacterized repeat protein (TIGR03943 family)